MIPDEIYYEPRALTYKLGKELKEKYAGVPWIPIESHNNIEALRSRDNADFARMKRYLIIGVRKSLKHMENNKISDYLVPYTSSGCSAMCLYCYLVCNYNKCSYLRLFVNREEMLDKIIREANASGRDTVFEIGSNSDLVLENKTTGNLEWTVTHFGKTNHGILTFPTKFDAVEPLLGLEHKRRVLMRMSVNPEEIIKTVELGTSPLNARIRALNRMSEDGYRTGLLIAPVVLDENWKERYARLLERLADELSATTKKQIQIEVIFMTYSYVHRAINREAFPGAPELYDPARMTGRGRGKYCYREDVRAEGEAWLRSQLSQKLGDIPIAYVV